ncbi:MAG: ATP synthase subunit I [Cellvibrionaceae bacterium]
MGNIKRPPVLRIPLVQLMFLLPVSFIVWWFSPAVAYSVLVGGIIQILPNTYFALYAFRYQGAQSASLALRAMSRGETGKFVLTLMGFALVFSLFKAVNVVALFVSYFVMIIVSVGVASQVIGQAKRKN